jgi:hypothetical protein
LCPRRDELRRGTGDRAAARNAWQPYERGALLRARAKGAALDPAVGGFFIVVIVVPRVPGIADVDGQAAARGEM